MAVTKTNVDLEALETMPPEDMIAWAYEHYGERAGIVTSFQNTGCVMIDMAHRVAPGMRVLTVDTLRLHQETYDLMNQIEERYGITVERFQPDPAQVKQMVDRHGEYLFFDNKAKQEYCCKIRKVEPNNRALDTLDLWITGLRRDHSNFRKDTARADYTFNEGRKLLKLAPLADWSHDDVESYVSEHDVPYNKLYDQGYTSIGCAICTTPTLPGEDIRAGRWRWFNHLDDTEK